MAAHFEVEHQTTEVRVELVPICPRCDVPMTFDHTHGNRDHFWCPQCRRNRVITRQPAT